MIKYIIRSRFKPYNVIFEGDDLVGVCLREADLRVAYLGGVDFRDVDLSGSSLAHPDRDWETNPH